MSASVFLVIAILTLAGALAAASLTKLIHAALSLVVAFVGIAAFYFLLGAEFVGLVQVFVYVGAVAVLIVFTILLTRRDAENTRGPNWSGMVIAVGVFGGLLWAILRTPSLSVAAPPIDTAEGLAADLSAKREFAPIVLLMLQDALDAPMPRRSASAPESSA